MNKCGIYEIVNTTNGKRYTGSAVDMPAREIGHWSMLRGNYHHSRHLQNAWNKHGEDAFEFRVLFYCDPIKEIMVDEFEQRAIDQKSEYNICKVAGSTLGVICTDETRAKISAAKKGHKHTAEMNAKKSAAQMGRKHTAEAKANMSVAQKGRKHTDEHRAKNSAAHIGHKHTAEARAKMSATRMGNQNCLGYKHTVEAKVNMSAALMGNQRTLGYKHTAKTKVKMSAAHKGGKHSEASKAKMSKAMMGHKRHTPESRAKLRAQRQKLTQSQVHDIKHLLALGDMSQKEIADHFPVADSAIYRINTGLTYADW